MRYFLSIFLCLLSLFASAELQVFTLELKHSPPELLVPELEPLLPDGGYISAHNNKIILRTTQDNYSEIVKLAQQLDVPQTPVLISVRRGSNQSNGSVQFSVNGQLVSGVEHSTRTHTSGNRTTVVTRNTTRVGTDNSEYQIRGLSGRTSFIATGSDVPVTTITTGPYGRPWPQQEYKSLKSGFYATPRVFDQQVTIEISTQHQQHAQEGAQRFNTESINTTVSGRLGEWIPIGNISQNGREKNTGLSHYRSTDDLSSQSYYLKVEIH